MIVITIFEAAWYVDVEGYLHNDRANAKIAQSPSAASTVAEAKKEAGAMLACLPTTPDRATAHIGETADRHYATLSRQTKRGLVHICRVDR